MANVQKATGHGYFFRDEELLLVIVNAIYIVYKMTSSFTLRWHHERTLHSLVLKNLNRLIGILRCNCCIQCLIINCKMD